MQRLAGTHFPSFFNKGRARTSNASSDLPCPADADPLRELATGASRLMINVG
jgi:hypothetical protein